MYNNRRSVGNFNNQIIVIFLSLFLFGLTSDGFCKTLAKEEGYDRNRAKLLSTVIKKQLVKLHYSQKPINDNLSKKAYDLYLKQVDPRKRFYLQKDIELLNFYSTKLDDEMNSGFIRFPLVAEEILKERVEFIKDYIAQISAIAIDYSKTESLETDNKKINYCKTEDELRERWRKTIKYQTISQYLDQLEINKTQNNNKSEAELKKIAKDKVIKRNNNLLRRMLKRETADLYDRFFTIIARAFDPHSSFMPPAQKEDFNIHMRGSLEGIGAVLQEDGGYIKVMRIIPGGAAYRQKQLHAEDIIMMVAQADGTPVDLVDMKIRDAVQLIRGKKGTEVRLTVKKPDGKMIVIPIIRDIVQLEETFVKSTVLKSEGEDQFGYIKIPSFYRDFQKSRLGGGRNVTDDVRNSLIELKQKNINGLIIDLRNNGGGALDDAVKVAGLFIESGPIVQIKTRDDKPHVWSDPDSNIYYDGPIVVLINRFSASASEILAGALQDYNRALIVGSEHSYGKGTVQTLYNLDEHIPFPGFNMSKYTPLGAMKLTTQIYYRVAGDSTQHRGVVPDIVLPDIFKYSEIGEQYSEYSLEWEKIDPAKYNKWSNSYFDIEKLKKESMQRIKSNDKFSEIIKESEDGRSRKEKTLILIDQASIQKDREQIKELRKTYGDNATGHDGQITSPNDKKANEQELTEEEKKQKLVKDLNEDPYIIESLYLLLKITS